MILKYYLTPCVIMAIFFPGLFPASLKAQTPPIDLTELSIEDLLDIHINRQRDRITIKDWADRPPKEGDIDDWRNRALNPPGSVMEYNDVRVNLLAYSLLQVWRQPLPKVLKQYLMDPIGASTTWRWFGYDHAWVNVDGQKVQSVTGGGHSGGGVFISTLDQARFGLLFARDGNWNGQQVISKAWIEKALTPSQAHDSYGFMWWLNQGQRKWQQVDDTSLYYAAGFGGNFIVIDSRNDLVVITRWLEPSKIGEMMKLVLEAQR